MLQFLIIALSGAVAYANDAWMVWGAIVLSILIIASLLPPETVEARE